MIKQKTLTMQINNANLSGLSVDPSDEVLLKQFVADSDRAAFDSLVVRNRSFVYRVSYIICGNNALAEEATQETFLWLASNAKRFFDLNHSYFEGWIYEVTLNISRNLCRSEKRMANRRFNSDFQDRVQRMGKEKSIQSERKNIEKEERKKQVQEVLNSLREDLRIPVILHFIEGKSQGEIARITGFSQSRVSQQIRKGLKILRYRLEGTCASLSAVGFTEWLKDSDCISYPSSLNETLRNEVDQVDLNGATEINAEPSSYFSSVNFSIPLMVGTALIVLVSSYFVSNLNEPSSTSAEKPTPNQPSVNNNVHKVWTFDDGPPADLELLFGKWKLGNHPVTGKSGIKAPEYSPGAGFKFPNPIQGKPTFVSCEFRHSQGGNYLMYVGRTNGASALSGDAFSLEHKNETQGKVQVMTAWLIQDYMIFIMNGEVAEIVKYADCKPDDSVFLHAQHWWIEKLEFRQMELDEVPESFRMPSLLVEKTKGVEIKKTVFHFKDLPVGAEMEGPNDGEKEFVNYVLKETDWDLEPYRRVWNFDSKLPQEFKPLVGNWRFQKAATPDKKSRAIVENNKKPTLISFPNGIPKRPFVVTFPMSALTEGWVGLQLGWANNDQFLAMRVWKIPAKEKPNFNMGFKRKIQIYVLGKYIVSEIPEAGMIMITEYRDLYPGTRLALVVNNVSIYSIEVGSLSKEEVPAEFRNIEKLLGSAGKTPEVVTPVKLPSP